MLCRSISLRLPALLVAAVLAACGGGGGGATAPQTGVTHTLNVAVSGSGRVASQPAGVDCQANCSPSFAEGTSLTLTATPASGQVFAGWGGDCSGSAPTCTLTLQADRTVTAGFTAAPSATQPLTVAITGNGRLVSNPAGIDCAATCTASFADRTVVTLTPVPATGQVFTAWGGACVGAGTTCTLTLSQARSAAATFAAAPPVTHLLGITLNGAGSVRSDPVGIDCGSTCSAPFANGVEVTLTATPSTGQVFAGWSGACSGTAATCAVSLTSARNVTASFAAAPTASTWQPAELMESSNDFNITSTSTAASFNGLVAVSTTGVSMVIWTQSDGTPDGSTTKVFSRRYVPGQGWEAAQQVPGLTNLSVSGFLFIDGAGVATWIRPNSETRRFTPGTGWGAAFLAPANTTGTMTAAKLDANGTIHAVISGTAVHSNTLPAGGTWGTWTRLDAAPSGLAATQADLALSANGTAMAIWRERNPGDTFYSLKAARFVPTAGWQAPLAIEAGFENVNSTSAPRVALDAAGNAIALWHQGNAVAYNVFSASGGWGTATTVDAGLVDSLFNARLNLAMAPDGRAVAAWNSGLFAMKAMVYTPGVGFADAVTAAPYSIDRTLAIDQNGHTTVVYRSPSQWPNPTSGTQNIYSLRLAWGSTWSAATLLETADGDTKGGVVAAFNPAGQGVAAWVQNDAAGTTARNSLWAALLR